MFGVLPLTPRQRSDPLGFRPYRGTGGYVRWGFAGGSLEVPGGFPGVSIGSPADRQGGSLSDRLLVIQIWIISDT